MAVHLQGRPAALPEHRSSGAVTSAGEASAVSGVGRVSGVLPAVLQGTHLVEQRLGEEDEEKCEGGVGMSVDRGVDLEGDNHELFDGG